MPSFPCDHPTCPEIVGRRGDRCPEHQAAGVAARPAGSSAERHRRYDREQRDREAKRFYDSAAWQRARAEKLAADPVCERCGAAFAKIVHHRKPLRECTPAERTAQSVLRGLCWPCHNTEEAEAKAAAEAEAGE